MVVKINGWLAVANVARALRQNWISQPKLICELLRDVAVNLRQVVARGRRPRLRQLNPIAVLSESYAMVRSPEACT